MVRKIILWTIWVLCAFLPVSAGGSAAASHELNMQVRHDLTVNVDPGKHALTASDRIRVKGDIPEEISFRLHRGLAPSTDTPGLRITREIGADESLFETYRLSIPRGLTEFVISYGGTIFHPVDTSMEQARGISSTPGIIAEEGVYLNGSSFWYPVFPVRLITFSLDLEIPKEFDAVSQGSRTVHERDTARTRVKWESPDLQDEIFLVASSFSEYEKTFVSPSQKSVAAMVFLRRDDRKLAEKYLDATVQYIGMYESLIGEYPYTKFALVENFWETGFGMPSFTLLGPSVIRLPFIITSSYPHEILHNWFGNSVFPDYEKGNWSEGLTAYLSDHLLKEQQGSAAEYRFTSLQKYADYALKQRDFSLLEFRSRYSPSSEAVGYGKGMLFFHMLRRDLGDEVFTEALREFYRSNRFRYATFEDLRESFEKASGRDLSAIFGQWLQRRGAPELRLEGITFQKEDGLYLIEGKVVQVQEEEPYQITVPLAVTVEESEQAVIVGLSMTGREANFSVPLKYRPRRVDVDPEADIFRRLHRNEIPAAISQVLGAERMEIIIPASVPEELRKAYIDFALDLSKSSEGIVSVAMDNEVDDFPKNRAAVILGWENRFAGEFLKMLTPSAKVEGEDILIDGKTVPKKDHAIVLTLRAPENREQALMMIAAPRQDMLPVLGRKLPHYHKYSYLVFEGDGVENVHKGRWPVLSSPLMAYFPGKDGGTALPERGKFWPREPLVTLPAQFTSEKMQETVDVLSDELLEGRGFGTAGLDRAADYIAERFREAGLKPGGDNEESYFQTWEDTGGAPEQKAVMKNVLGFIPGSKPEYEGQSIVIGAHYDHLGRGWPDVRSGNAGVVHPGADDNASGVAVLIQLAKVLSRNMKPDRTVVFAAFTGEEAGRRGSRHYLLQAGHFPAERIMAMLNLDTVGRLGSRKLLVLGSSSAREWPHIFRGAGYLTGTEIDMVSEQLDASDNLSFSEKGIPAVQLFSGPHPDYHRPSDTADKVDADGLVRVASVAKEAVEYLAGRETPLTVAGKAEIEDSPGAKTTRTVSLGTIPDFAFTGTGCRITGVIAGSPAEACGLQEGDIIVGINEKPVKGLKDLSAVLKVHQPGSRVTVTFLRGGKKMTTDALLTAR